MVVDETKDFSGDNPAAAVDSALAVAELEVALSGCTQAITLLEIMWICAPQFDR